MRVTNLARVAWLLASAGGLAHAQTQGEPTALPAASAPETETTAMVAVDAPEEAAPAPTAAESDSRFVQEVVVTAQKREEKLQDVPISVQAFGGELLDAMGVTDQTDLQRVTPGLNISSQVSYVITFLRGVGTDAAIAADPSVATYIDGIYYPFASNLAQNFGAVDRIEVLKGPQGTLFGRNATGGAISIYTREPDFDSVSGEVNASVGSFGTKKSRAYFNVPLTDWLAFNVSAIASESRGFYEGTRGVPPVGFPKDKEVGARMKVRIQPTENLEIHLAGLIHQLHGGAANISFNSAPSTLGTLLGIQPQTGYRGSIDSHAYTQTDPNRVF
ncbi:MAG TPA: TonB-dependent receptor plug domain-containing protein, partial [Nevskiaceae bacterium]|nr:TonB-dependent receptor plug domain-containing protein [Nevskiaceae bacterium]